MTITMTAHDAVRCFLIISNAILQTKNENMIFEYDYQADNEKYPYLNVRKGQKFLEAFLQLTLPSQNLRVMSLISQLLFKYFQQPKSNQGYMSTFKRRQLVQSLPNKQNLIRFPLNQVKLKRTVNFKYQKVTFNKYNLSASI